MAMRRDIGDQMLAGAEIDVPYAKALMTSSLSKYICFAANDCGYFGTRHTLVASWIHPLFLKAKTEASESGNPGWASSVNGRFREGYWTVACKKIEILEPMDAPEAVDRSDNMSIIHSIWVSS